MKRCTKCILPESYPNIEYDSDGICNSCKTETVAYEPKGIDALHAAIAKFRNTDGKYDCLVAISGGRDSSYVLHYVVKKLKLRPLALTVDNGFMPDETRQNISNAVRELGVDHTYYRQTGTLSSFAATLKAWQKHPDPGMIAMLCNGCMGPIRKAVKVTADENDITFIIGGGGDVVGGGGEPERSFAEYLIGIGNGKLNPRLSMIFGALYRLLSNPRYLQHPAVLMSYVKEAYFRYWFHYPKHLNIIGLFEFIGWDEDEIVTTIQDRLGWKKPPYWNTTWRADCKIHWLKEFMYRETLGLTKNDELLSGMVRWGLIDREEAYTRLHKSNELPEEFLADFLAEHGIDFEQIRDASHNWRESKAKA